MARRQRDPLRPHPGCRRSSPRLGAGDPRIHRSGPQILRPRPATLGRAHPGGAHGVETWLLDWGRSPTRPIELPHRRETSSNGSIARSTRCGEAANGRRPALAGHFHGGLLALLYCIRYPGKARCAGHAVDPGGVRFGRRRVRSVAPCVRRRTARRRPRQHSRSARRGAGRGVIADGLVRRRVPRTCWTAWIPQPPRPNRAVRAGPALSSRVSRERRSAGSTVPSTATTRSPRAAARSSTATGTTLSRLETAAAERPRARRPGRAARCASLPSRERWAGGAPGSNRGAAGRALRSADREGPAHDELLPEHCRVAGGAHAGDPRKAGLRPMESLPRAECAPAPPTDSRRS